MGQSADAYLFYGMTLLEEEVPDWLQKHIGEDDDDDGGGSYELDKKLQAEFGVGLYQHCSYDFPMYFLSIGDSSYKSLSRAPGFSVAWRGTPRRFDRIEAWSFWDEKLNKAADSLGWPETERNIGWWLASMWG